MALYAYATTNLLTGLGAAAFTWSAGLNDATRSRLVDGRMSELYVNGNVAAAINVVIDFGSAVALTGFAILNGNASGPGCNVKVESADNAGMSTNLVVRKADSLLSSTTPKNKDHVLQFAAGTARRFWRITWTPAGTINNFQIGELWAFNGQVSIARRAIYGDGETRSFKTAEVEYYNGGSRAFRLGGPVRSLRLPFSDMTSAELESLYALLAAVNGGATPFLWINSYEATALAAAAAEQEVIYGRITSPDFTFSVPDFNLFTPDELMIKSLGREIGA